MPKSLKSLIDLFDDETRLFVYDEHLGILIARNKASELKKAHNIKDYVITYLSIKPSCEVVVYVIYKLNG